MLHAWGARAHLAHTLGSRKPAIGGRKTTYATPVIWLICCGSADCPRRGSLRPQTRELREFVRCRAKLVPIRSGLKAQIHAVLAKAGVLIAVSDLFGVTGRHRLAKVPLGSADAQRISSRWNSSTSRWPRSALRRTIAERLGPTTAIKRSSNYPAWGRCWRWCRRRDWRHTPFADPHPSSGADTSPSRAGNSCDGRPSRPSSASPTTKIALDRNALKAAAAANSPRSPRPARCSPSSTTGCVMNRSAPWRTGRRREHFGRNTREAAQLSGPRISARSPF